jgi:hypothetical protein
MEVEKCRLCGTGLDADARHVEGPPFLIHEPKVCRDILTSKLREVRDWEDVDDEWTEEIKQAHPARSGTHDEYATAMRMVGHRHSKGALVALVTWLLFRLEEHKHDAWERSERD